MVLEHSKSDATLALAIADSILLSFDPIKEFILNLDILFSSILSQPDAIGLNKLLAQADSLTKHILLLLKNARSAIDQFSCTNDVMIRNQTQRLDKTLLEIAGSFYNVQNQYKIRRQALLMKQAKTICSTATESQVYSLNSKDLFKQQMVIATDGDVKNRLKLVETRHDEIVKIENAMGDLLIAFEDLTRLLAVQNKQITLIETGCEETVVELEAANKDLDEGVKYIRTARSKGKLLVVFAFLGLGILALVLYLVFK